MTARAVPWPGVAALALLAVALFAPPDWQQAIGKSIGFLFGLSVVAALIIQLTRR